MLILPVRRSRWTRTSIQITVYAKSTFSTRLCYNSIRIPASDQHERFESIVGQETGTVELNGGKFREDRKRAGGKQESKPRFQKYQVSQEKTRLGCWSVTPSGGISTPPYSVLFPPQKTVEARVN